MVKGNVEILRDVLELAEKRLNALGNIGYTTPDGNHHIQISLDGSLRRGRHSYSVAPNRVVDGALEPMGEPISVPYNNFGELMIACVSCLETFERDLSMIKDNETLSKDFLSEYIKAEVPFRMEDIYEIPLSEDAKAFLIKSVVDNVDIMFNYDQFDSFLFEKHKEFLSEKLQSYEAVIAHTCEALNKLDVDGSQRSVADFQPIFESTNHFGLYCYNGDNEYYLVSKEDGLVTLVLGDSPDFVGRNLLDELSGEWVSHVENKELLTSLVEGTRENVSDFFTERYLGGLHALENAVRGTWLCVYKDCLGHIDEHDNLTEILVPNNWLANALREQGVTEYNKWLDEYTADDTQDIARTALAEGVILDCVHKEIAIQPKREQSLAEKISAAVQAKNLDDSTGVLKDHKQRLDDR